MLQLEGTIYVKKILVLGTITLIITVLVLLLNINSEKINALQQVDNKTASPIECTA